MGLILLIPSHLSSPANCETHVLWISACARALPSLVPSIAALWASPGSSLSLPRAVQEEEVKEEAALGFLGVSGCHLEELQLINHTQACGVLADPEGPFAVCHQTVAPEPFLE